MTFQSDEQSAILTRFAEFKDKSLEPLYFEEEMRGMLRYVRVFILLYGISLLLVSTYEFFHMIHPHIFAMAMSFRSIVFVASAGMFVLMGRRCRPNHMQFFIVLYELLVFAAYIGVLLISDAHNIADYGLAMMALVLAVFLIPGRWVVIELLAAAILLTFMVLSAALAEALHPDFLRTQIYLWLCFVFMSISSHRASRMSRLQYHKQFLLSRQSVVDKLTGIFNRARFDEALAEWTGLFHRYRTPFSLIMFDLDNYKRVNDVYGHFVGDEVLRRCVAEVQRSLRTGDIFARWGGEEFAILMPYSNLQTAYEHAELLRKRIGQADLGDPGRITASFGVTEIKAGDTADSLIQRVDKYMYLGKRSGKNIVIKGMEQPNMVAKP